jgi:hypothetical protein
MGGKEKEEKKDARESTIEGIFYDGTRCFPPHHSPIRDDEYPDDECVRPVLDGVEPTHVDDINQTSRK